MKRALLASSLLLLAAVSAACSGGTSVTKTDLPNDLTGDGQIDGTPDGDGRTPGSSSDMGSAAPSAGGSSSGGTGATGGGNGSISPGTLTAGVWDDNRNYSSFTSFRDGIVDKSGLPQLTGTEQDAANAKSLGAPVARQKIDVQIVIDTTGSMGDEINYLNTEFDAITQSIQAKYPNAEQRWSLVAYKDKHDDYIVRWFDFRTDLVEMHAKLSTLEASGGGDFEESPEQALEVGSRLSWRSAPDVAKMVFWVADAPHHAADSPAMTDALRHLRDKGAHVYPVASSGIDDVTEYTMRSAAQITGGRYVFLTDDSGVGGAHAVPQVPCFFVTKLNDAIYRMVDIELNGQYREPTAAEIIRTGGDPHNGACQVEGGGQVVIY